MVKHTYSTWHNDPLNRVDKILPRTHGRALRQRSFNFDVNIDNEWYQNVSGEGAAIDIDWDHPFPNVMLSATQNAWASIYSRGLYTRLNDKWYLSAKVNFDTSALVLNTYGSLTNDDKTKYTTAVPAEGTITTVAKDNLIDGETFTIGDGVLTKIFEFDVNGTGISSPTHVRVNVSGATDAPSVTTIMVTAINGSGLGITASPTDGGSEVALVKNTTGILGNVAITSTVADGGWATSGMENGVDPDTLALNDQVNTAVVFEFDVLGEGVQPGHTAIDLSAISTQGEIQTAIITAINAYADAHTATFFIRAEAAEGNITLRNQAGYASDTSIVITVTNGDALSGSQINGNTDNRSYMSLGLDDDDSSLCSFVLAGNEENDNMNHLYVYWTQNGEGVQRFDTGVSIYTRGQGVVDPDLNWHTLTLYNDGVNLRWSIDGLPSEVVAVSSLLSNELMGLSVYTYVDDVSESVQMELANLYVAGEHDLDPADPSME